jgi:Icc protein
MTQTSPTHILQITDLHLKADSAALWRGHNVQNSLDAVLKLACEHNHWPPALILVTGDIVDDETPEGYRQTYQRLAAQLRQLLGDAARTTAIGFIPGNHDDAGILKRSCAELNIQGCGVFTLNNWQIIQLDSTLANSDDGELGAVQLSVLESALMEPAAPYSLIVLHHPLVKLDSQWMDSMRVKDSEALFQCIDRYNDQTSDINVRAILWGHAHQETDLRYPLRHQQLRLLGAPAAGPVQFTVASDDFAIDTDLPAGLRWLTLGEDGSIETIVNRIKK